jgi:hypothetical protein
MNCRKLFDGGPCINNVRLMVHVLLKFYMSLLFLTIIVIFWTLLPGIWVSVI